VSIFAWSFLRNEDQTENYANLLHPAGVVV